MFTIQGIGDEVIEFFLVLGLITIGLIAWWSTSINHRPLIRTVLIFEHRTRSRVTTNNNNNNSVPTNPEGPRNVVEPLPSESSEEHVQVVETEDTESEIVAEPTAESNEEIEQNEIVETMDSDAAVIRQRRLSFFKKSNDPKSEDEPHTSTAQNPELAESTKAEPTKSSPTEKDDDLIRIKLKFLNDNIRAVEGKKREKLGDFKRRHFEVEISECKLVRLIFNGQILQRDTDTLQNCGLFDNCVVHCLVIQQQSRSNPESSDAGDQNRSTRTSFSVPPNINTGSQTSQSSNQWDFGNMLFALVTLLLTGAWYFRYEYAQLFTITATVLLVCLTGVFSLLLIGIIYPDAPVVIETQTADSPQTS